MSGPPTNIMIIRHGEKPPKSPGKNGPWDVLVDGESGSGKSLVVPEWSGSAERFLCSLSRKAGKSGDREARLYLRCRSQRGESSPLGDGHASGGPGSAISKAPHSSM